VAVVGASGAIAGVMAAYLLLFRQARLTVMLLVFQFKVPALIWIGVWFGLQLGGALLDPTSAASGIAWMAHVGGFLAGLLIIWPMEESLLRQHPLLRVLRTYRPPPAAARLHEPNPSKMRYR
jgi:membrane associated rhomboid family serine protease